MPYYRIALQDIHFAYPIVELDFCEIKKNRVLAAVQSPPKLLFESVLISHSLGWVGNANRQVEIWSAPAGFLFKVEGGSGFYMSEDGQEISLINHQKEQVGQFALPALLMDLDREILLGPVIVFTLALRNTWSFHTSAAMFKDKIILFMGESGMGKSTLARYISTQKNWRLVADDILPVIADDISVMALPRFPQLKLPINAQPGVSLPEQLPIHAICILQTVDKNAAPHLNFIQPSLAVRDILAHTAGTRMFTPELLAAHLNVCAKIVKLLPVYHLSYPHRKEILPEVKDVLENIC